MILLPELVFIKCKVYPCVGFLFLQTFHKLLLSVSVLYLRALVVYKPSPLPVSAFQIPNQQPATSLRLTCRAFLHGRAVLHRAPAAKLASEDVRKAVKKYEENNEVLNLKKAF